MGSSQRDSHSRLWMTVGRSVSAKWPKMAQHSEWMPRQEKFSENALWVSSLRNRRERGAWSEEEEAPKWRGFQAGVDLCLGAIDTSNVTNRRRKEKETIRKVPKQFTIIRICEKKYTCMENAWTCDMQSKYIMFSAQSNPTSTQRDCTHLNVW